MSSLRRCEGCPCTELRVQLSLLVHLRRPYRLHGRPRHIRGSIAVPAWRRRFGSRHIARAVSRAGRAGVRGNLLTRGLGLAPRALQLRLRIVKPPARLPPPPAHSHGGHSRPSRRSTSRPVPRPPCGPSSAAPTPPAAPRARLAERYTHRWLWPSPPAAPALSRSAAEAVPPWTRPTAHAPSPGPRRTSPPQRPARHPAKRPQALAASPPWPPIRASHPQLSARPLDASRPRTAPPPPPPPPSASPLPPSPTRPALPPAARLPPAAPPAAPPLAPPPRRLLGAAPAWCTTCAVPLPSASSPAADRLPLTAIGSPHPAPP
eukprot:scaffold2800_cov135-Isochrysis_galbana.AAC.2